MNNVVPAFTKQGKYLTYTDKQYIVAMGASAGGMEALHSFFDAMPADSNFSFIVIQHLSADYKSMLNELLAKHTSMKVVPAEEGQLVERGHIYVIPNDKYITLNQGKLCLESKDVHKGPNMAIDIFLESLAADQQEKAIAIILSGTGSDGTKGAQAIKRAGGTVFAQEPQSAKFDSMPASVIASGSVDYILSPGSMAEELMIFQHNTSKGVITDTLSPQDETVLIEIFNYLKSRTSCDFMHYKRPTIIRRLTRRMAFLNLPTLSGYLQFLKQTEDEPAYLCKEFLIGVTQFFRDEEVFDQLKLKILPEIISTKPVSETIKVWVAGCSTGEEAYSIAILFKEHFENLQREYDIKIFASDIDKEAIDFAARGIYSANQVSNVSGDRLRNYFVEDGDQYRVAPAIRKMVIFSHHDVVKDSPFGKLDLVSCRNLLIYFNNTLQSKAINAFHFALNVGGYLVLGPSENIGEQKSAFLELDKKWKIYKNIKQSKGFRIEGTEPGVSLRGSIPQLITAKSKNQTVYSDFLIESLLSTTEAAAVYIDANFNLVDSFGDYKKYLELPDKKFNLNFLKMLPQKISVLLGSHLRKVSKDNDAVHLSNIRFENSQGSTYVDIHIRPCSEKLFSQQMYLVLFKETVHTESPLQNHVSSDELNIDDFLVLEQELKETKEYLQKAIEDMEASNEELQSSNEELISANEELQSTNEELQSLNEELHTLNAEYQLKIQEISELNDDLNNFLGSTDIGQIFLDAKLIIRKFTPAATQFINLIESDIGRPITHISYNMLYPGLLDDIHKVLSTHETVQKNIEVSSEVWYQLKVLPYVREGRYIDGVVLTFVDITDIKKLAANLEKEREFLNAVLENIDDGIVASDEKGSIVLFNKAIRNMFGVARDTEHKDLPAYKLFTTDNTPIAKEEAPLHRIQRGEQVVNMEIILTPENDENRLVVANGQQITSAEGKVLGAVVALHDITEQRKAEQEIISINENLKKVNDELEERVRQRTKTINHQKDTLHNILMQLPALVCTSKGPDHVYDLVNPLYQEMFPDRKLQGMPVREALPEFNDQGFFELLDGVYQTGNAFIGNEIKALIKTSEGETQERYYNFIYQPLRDEYNEVNGILTFAYDVTTQVTSRALLQQANDELINISNELKFVANFMPQLVWTTRADGYHEFYNDKWYEYTGLTHEESENKGWSTVLHPDDYDRAWQVWSRSLQTGEPYEIEYRFKKWDGSYRWFLGRALPLRNEEGKIVKWFGTCTDIHDQRQVNEQLKKTQEQLSQINAELLSKNEMLVRINTDLDNFIYTASHDLRSPISNIEGLTSILTKKLTDRLEGPESRMIEMINTSIIKFKNTINDLTTITKAQRNLNEEVSQISFKETVEDVTTDIKDLIEEAGAVITTDFAIQDIMYTRYNLRSIIYNLVSNAIKYRSPERRAQVRISTSEEDGYVLLAVADNGLGLHPAQKEKLFGMFKRMHKHVEGSGIGLYIIKRMIENNGGKIEVESELDKGTTFKVYLKYEKENTAKVVE